MQPRIEYAKVAPAGMTAMLGLENYVRQSGLDPALLELVKRVIDVRSIPRSRHNPKFNRETLSAKLRSARIDYVHLRKLGGLRHAQRGSVVGFGLAH